ncbi:MAG: two-component system cell cycle sensor histidine kinase/response regulator CckA [Polyangiales bacterium]|jgi:two-component system cell cycle sensor histidine kinase/response regulator CckA
MKILCSRVLMGSHDPLVPSASPNLQVLRALIVDLEEGTSLTLQALIQHGFEVSHERVENADQFDEALHRQRWDIVISNYALPTFSGLNALQLLEGAGVKIPLVVVSNHIGEEAAVHIMRSGAADFVLRDRLWRLPAVVERELRNAQALESAHARGSSEAELSVLKAAIERLPGGVLIVKWEDKTDLGSFLFEYCNGAAREASQVAGFELVGSRTRDIPATIELGIAGAYARAIQTGEMQTLPQVRYGDERFPSQIIDIRVVKLDEERALVLLEDVADRINAERRVQAAQRMEAVCRLAGGIAHDFGNVLTVVLTYARFLKDAFEEGHPSQDDVSAILEAGSRASYLTKQLLAFSHRESTPVDLLDTFDSTQVIGEIATFVGRIAGAGVELTTRVATDLWPMGIGRSELDRVVVNLAINACDAMPTTGALTLEAKNVSMDESDNAGEQHVSPGEYVVLAVSDTGCGMDQETQEHIFEPFFTTKELGKGTGLGLATVFRIVRECGGFIRVRSQVGVGTSFEIYLPHVDVRKPSALKRRVLEPRGSETVLLVEDDKEVRAAVTRSLETHGYTVIQASDGPDAVRVYVRQGGGIDILLTDVAMPQMNGVHLARELSEADPDLPVLLMSGHPEKTITQLGGPTIMAGMVRKPFSPAHLLQALRTTLDDPRIPRPRETR